MLLTPKVRLASLQSELKPEMSTRKVKGKLYLEAVLFDRCGIQTSRHSQVPKKGESAGKEKVDMDRSSIDSCHSWTILVPVANDGALTRAAWLTFFRKIVA